MYIYIYIYLFYKPYKTTDRVGLFLAGKQVEFESTKTKRKRLMVETHFNKKPSLGNSSLVKVMEASLFYNQNGYKGDKICQPLNVEFLTIKSDHYFFKILNRMKKITELQFNIQSIKKN